jgi:hypothetical protein
MHMVECAKFLFKLLGNDKNLHQYWKTSYPNGNTYGFNGISIFGDTLGITNYLQTYSTTYQMLNTNNVKSLAT